jgi:hypothetical protein
MTNKVNADKIIWTGNTLNELRDLLGSDIEFEFEEEILDEEGLDFPWPISVKSVDVDTTRGDTSVDVTIAFDSVDGAETYEVRFSPVGDVAPPPVETSDYTITMAYNAATIFNEGVPIEYVDTDLEVIGLHDSNTSAACITDIGPQPEIQIHFVYSFPIGAKLKALELDVYGTTTVDDTEFGGYADYTSNGLNLDLTKWSTSTNLVDTGSFHFNPTITFAPGDLMDDWYDIGTAPTDIWLTMNTPYGGTQTITIAEAKMTATYAA